MIIRVTDWEVARPEDKVYDDPKSVKVNMWYDRHLRLWEIWEVDAEGNQWKESRYAPNKAEALEIKKELEAEIMNA